MAEVKTAFSSKIFILLIIILTSGIIYNSYNLLDLWNNKIILRENIISKDSLSTIQVNVLNGCGKKGVADKVTNYIRNLGYDVVDVGNYQNFNVKETLIIDRIGTTNNIENKIPFLIASQLGVEKGNVVKQINQSFYVNTTILIGSDFKNLNPWK